MSFNIPQDLNDAVKGSLDTGGGVTLPFPHVFFSFRNGQRQAGKDKAEQYFGGFQADQEKFVAYLEEVDKREVVKNFTLHQLTPRTGEPYFAYMRRAMAIAPIAVRQRWFVNEGKNVLKAQVVGLMAIGKPLEYVGPVVLTASGFFQSKNLVAAINTNNSNTASARRNHASGAAPNFFYQFIGTFGEEALFEMVGKAGNQSPITPIKPSPAKVETAEGLQQLYVGDELARRVAEYKKLSEDWVADWRQKDKPTEAGNNAQDREPSPDELFGPLDDDINF